MLVANYAFAALDPGAAAGFSPNRILEGIIGGTTALAVSATFFPPDPALGPGRAAQAMFAELGRALESTAAPLEPRENILEDALRAATAQSAAPAAAKRPR